MYFIVPNARDLDHSAWASRQSRSHPFLEHSSTSIFLAPIKFSIVEDAYTIISQESYFTYDPSTPLSPVDHDIHFRPGVNAKGEETYTPRTLIYDLKGGFGGLRKWGGLYDQQLSLEGAAAQQQQNTVW